MKTQLTATVGRLGKNLQPDVETIQALLNVIHRQSNQRTLNVNGRCNEETLTALENFQQSLHKLCLQTWPLVHHRCPTHQALQKTLEKTVRPSALEQPLRGVLTWESEGREGGPFHSRSLHVPSKHSGLTIGRGYDCSQKGSKEILTDLMDAGLDTPKALVLSKASGLRGMAAERFITSNDLLDFQITPEQQLRLFKTTYAAIRDYMVKVSQTQKVNRALSSVNWASIDHRIVDVLVDLTYRGDYTTSSRALIADSVISNDFEGLCGVLRDKATWAKVPTDRFHRRVNFCESNL